MKKKQHLLEVMLSFGLLVLHFCLSFVHLQALIKCSPINQSRCGWMWALASQGTGVETFSRSISTRLITINYLMLKGPGTSGSGASPLRASGFLECEIQSDIDTPWHRRVQNLSHGVWSAAGMPSVEQRRNARSLFLRDVSSLKVWAKMDVMNIHTAVHCFLIHKGVFHLQQLYSAYKIKNKIRYRSKIYLIWTDDINYPHVSYRTQQTLMGYDQNIAIMLIIMLCFFCFLLWWPGWSQIKL